MFHCRNSERLMHKLDLGKKLCSACVSGTFASGEPNKYGKWHNRFKRTYLPKGEFITNDQGNIEHIKSGLIGNEAYKKYGSDTEINK